MATFGKRLRAAREAAGYSQRDVGRLLGLAHTAIGGWEREERNPQHETLVKLGHLYGVSIDYLLYGDTDMSDGTSDRHLISILRDAGATNQDIQTILDLVDVRRKAKQLQRRIEASTDDS